MLEPGDRQRRRGLNKLRGGRKLQFPNRYDCKIPIEKILGVHSLNFAFRFSNRKYFQSKIKCTILGRKFGQEKITAS